MSQSKDDIWKVFTNAKANGFWDINRAFVARLCFAVILLVKWQGTNMNKDQLRAYELCELNVEFDERPNVPALTTLQRLNAALDCIWRPFCVCIYAICSNWHMFWNRLNLGQFRLQFLPMQFQKGVDSQHAYVWDYVDANVRF